MAKTIEEAWAEFVQHYDGALQDERDAAGGRSVRGSQPWVHDRVRAAMLAVLEEALGPISTSRYAALLPSALALRDRIEALGKEAPDGSD